jgi:hypothetical protein
MVKIGERVIVNHCSFPAYVEKIKPEDEAGRIEITIDWKEHGKSRVYLHDEGSTWVRYSTVN